MAFAVTDGLGSNLLAVAAVMIALSTIAVGLRIWSRFVAQKCGLWWDDWLCLAALPCIFALCSLTIYWVYIGLGQHIIHVKYVPAKNGIILLVVEIVYNTGLTLIKLSVLMFYTRVFGAVKHYRIIFWVVGFLLLAWWLGVNCLAIFPCRPIRKAWDSTVPGWCLNEETNFVATAISNIATDLILLIIPMPIFWRLHTSTRRKVGLVAVFTAGYLVLILSVVRFVFIAIQGASLDKDITWNSVTSQILLVLEISIALISSCIPSIFNLAKHGAERFSRLSSGRKTSSKTRQGSWKSGRSGLNSSLGLVTVSIERRRGNGFQHIGSEQIAGKGSRSPLSASENSKQTSSNMTYSSDIV